MNIFKSFNKKSIPLNSYQEKLVRIPLQVERAVNEFPAVIEETTAAIEEITATVQTQNDKNDELFETIKQTDGAVEVLSKIN
jgi:methyl-accepting chemotaxis protein